MFPFVLCVLYVKSTGDLDLVNTGGAAFMTRTVVWVVVVVVVLLAWEDTLIDLRRSVKYRMCSVITEHIRAQTGVCHDC